MFVAGIFSETIKWGAINEAPFEASFRLSGIFENSLFLEKIARGLFSVLVNLALEGNILTFVTFLSRDTLDFLKQNKEILKKDILSLFLSRKGNVSYEELIFIGNLSLISLNTTKKLVCIFYYKGISMRFRISSSHTKSINLEIFPFEISFTSVINDESAEKKTSLFHIHNTVKNMLLEHLLRAYYLSCNIKKILSPKDTLLLEKTHGLKEKGHLKGCKGEIPVIAIAEVQ